jgi:hypothetical protein
LFDLDTDPAETNDLSEDETYNSERERLRELLKQSQAALNDPLASD